MVLYPHAESIDKDSDHDPPVEVFALHNPLQFLPEAYPGPNHSIFVLHHSSPSVATPSASQINTLIEKKGEVYLENMQNI